MGANIEAANNDGWTALMYAARNSHEKVIDALLAMGANIEVANNDGLTALMHAASQGHGRALKALLGESSNLAAVNLPRAKDSKGRTALMHAKDSFSDFERYDSSAEDWLSHYTTAKEALVLPPLLEKLADYDEGAKDIAREIILIIASKRCRHDLIEALLREHPTLDCKVPAGLMALRLVATYGEELYGQHLSGPELKEEREESKEREILDILLWQSSGTYSFLDDMEFDAAEPLHRGAEGVDHPSYATTVDYLAGLLKAQGEYDAAEPSYRRALAVYEKVLGVDHPSYARMLNDLAELFKAQGKYDAAEPLYRSALAVKEKAVGVDHPDYATMLSDWAELLKAQGKYDAAEQLYRCALAVYEKALGVDHPKYIIALHNLARVLKSQGLHRTEGEMQNDSAVGIDLLGYDRYAKAITEAIRKAPSPICIGIFGRWGSGKSFLLQKIMDQLRSSNRQTGDVPRRFPCQLPVILLFYFGGMLWWSVDAILITIRDLCMLCFDLCMWCFPCHDGMEKAFSKMLCWDVNKSLTSLRDLRTRCFQCCGSKSPYHSITTIIMRGMPDPSAGLTSKIIFSSLLERIDDKTKSDNRYLKVDFNAWLYAGSDKLWAGIIKEMYDKVEKDPELKWPLIKSRISQIVKRQGGYNLFSLLFLGALGALIGLEFSGKLEDGPLPGDKDDDNDDDEDSDAVTRLLTIVLGAVGLSGVIIQALLFVFKHMVNEGGRILEQVNGLDVSKELGFMAKVEKGLDELYGFLKGKGVSLSVTVDDLDRCSHSQVVRVLEATMLLLCKCDAPVIVFLAIDPRVVVSSIEASYASVMRDARINGYEYLDKIIQLPFCLPDANAESRRFLLSKVLLGNTLASAISSLEWLAHKVTQALQAEATKNIAISPGLLAFLEKDHQWETMDKGKKQELLLEAALLACEKYEWRSNERRSKLERSMEMAKGLDMENPTEESSQAMEAVCIFMNRWTFINLKWLEDEQRKAAENAQKRLEDERKKALEKAETDALKRLDEQRKAADKNESDEGASAGSAALEVKAADKNESDEGTSAGSAALEVKAASNDDGGAQQDPGKGVSGNVSGNTEAQHQAENVNGSGVTEQEPSRVVRRGDGHQQAPFEPKTVKGDQHRLHCNVDEFRAFEDFEGFIDSNPRRLKRIGNIYNVLRELKPAWKKQDTARNTRKVIKWLILSEQWPYRSTVLLQFVEDCLQRQKVKEKSPWKTTSKHPKLRWLRPLVDLEKNKGDKITNYFDIIEQLIHVNCCSRTLLPLDSDPERFWMLMFEDPPILINDLAEGGLLVESSFNLNPLLRDIVAGDFEKNVLWVRQEGGEESKQNETVASLCENGKAFTVQSRLRSEFGTVSGFMHPKDAFGKLVKY
ncbi:unnamed protein product [Chrysoparadoxa australica]